MAITDPLILYPDPLANSFITLQEADDIIEMTINNYLWIELSDEDRKRHLIKAFKRIYSIIEDNIPTPLDLCVAESQALLALQYLINAKDYDERRIKAEKLGPMSTTYQDQDMLLPEELTDEIAACLGKYGYLTFNNTVGSIQKTRYKNP